MRQFFSLLLFAFVASNVVAQKKEFFEIQISTIKPEGGFYNKIRFIDSREDTTHLGFVSTGALKERTLVFGKRPIVEQITDVMKALTDSTSQSRTMLFQLRRFNFLEYPGLHNDRGYFFLKASVYYQHDDRYRRIRTIDTLIETSGATYILFNEASRTLISFLRNSLWQPPQDKETYSYSNVLSIDSVEKSKLKAYTIPILKDGMYRNFKSFINQEPDMEVIVDRKNNEIHSVKIDGGNGKTFGVKLKEIYALVDKGQAFLVVENEYCPMNRTNGDFYFKGRAKAGGSAGEIIGFFAAGMFDSPLGNPMAGNSAKPMFEMKLDHSNGEFIRLRRAK